MKIKFKLSIMMIAIVLVIAGGIAVIELVRASNIAPCTLTRRWKR